MLEDIAVDPFGHSSFGTVVMTLFQGILTAPSWHTFPSLACGWALASDRHTLTTYVWLPGATTVTHLSRFSGFLGWSLDHRRWQLWGAVSRLAAPFHGGCQRLASCECWLRGALPPRTLAGGGLRRPMWSGVCRSGPRSTPDRPSRRQSVAAPRATKAP